MSNTQVNRMATRRDASTSFVVPPIPDIPATLLARLPEFRVWQTEMTEWRNRFTAGLKAQIDDLKSGTGPFNVEVRTSDPANPVNGQIWLLV